jgi:hypothetical protein
MDPITASLIIGLVGELIKDSPELIAEFQAIFAKENPTPQDWLDLRAKVEAQSFATLAPHAKLL